MARFVSPFAQWILSRNSNVTHRFRREFGGSYVLLAENCEKIGELSPFVSVAVRDLELLPKTDDKLYDLQWNINNSGQDFSNLDSVGPGIHGIDFNIEEAWAIHENREEVVIAMFEYGIDTNHPDLNSNFFQNIAELNGTAGVDDDGNGYIDDIHGANMSLNNGDIDMHRSKSIDPHGTGVGGVAIATTNNGFGAAGVFDGARLLTITGDDPNQTLLSFISDLTKGIGYLIDMKTRYDNNDGGANVRVLNISLGNFFSCERGIHPSIDAFLDASDAANKAGILIVGATSNLSINHDGKVKEWPTNCEGPNQITVGSINRAGKLASSGYGIHSVELAAPGHQVLVPWYFDDLGSAFAFVSGTSFAAPGVAAISAMISSMYPTLAPAEISQILIDSSDELPDLKGKITSGGKINAYSALLLAGERAVSQNPLGDFDGDGNLDSSDIDLLSTAVREQSLDLTYDVNSDGSIDQLDRNYWITELKKTWLGDSNLDGVFDSSDFTFAFTAGEYEDETLGNSGWSEGDWNGDGDFDSSDLVVAFAAGGYNSGPLP
ncbi:MAG: S8 family serine peptidase [Bdellovibrionales bacterium]|nr:S8 family serine peptidase [Bdellovibrionales bacterium]